MAWETVAGTVLACSASLPATYDAAGYGALSFTAVGEVTNIDGELGRVYNTVEHAPIASSQRIQRKGTYVVGTSEIRLAWDQSDAGQDLLRTAANDANDIMSFKITKQGGDIRWFTAQVQKFVETFGSGDDVNAGMITLLRQTDVVMSPA